MNNSEKITYICDNINELNKIYRKEILQILLSSQSTEDKLLEKGGGTQIKFSEIPDELLNNIYNYILHKVTSDESQ